MMRLIGILITVLLTSSTVLAQTNLGKNTIVGEWKYASHYLDSKDTATIDWPIGEMTFTANGSFEIRADTALLIGKFEFADPSIVLKEVVKNGVELDGEQILFLSNLDATSMTIQARMETGTLYVEFERITRSKAP